LPRRLRCCEDFADSQALHAPAEPLAVHLVAIAEEVGRRGVVRKASRICWAAQVAWDAR
jgi:hypothetical protein